MSPTARREPNRTRRLWLTLAVLAVCLKVLAPVGYMLAAPSEDRPFPLVLCTGEGLVTVSAETAADSEGEHAPVDGDAHDAPCPFAASPAAGLEPASWLWAPVGFFLPQPPQARPQTHLAPGRGLAAPPPARAPPTLLI